MSSHRKVAAADVPLHTLDSPEVLDAILGPSSSQGDDVKLLKPAHAEAVPLTSTHWRLTAKVPGGETSSSSGLTTDVSGLEPLVSIPDVPESLERYVSVAVMALQGSSASTARDSSKAAEAVKEALAAVAQAASSAAPAAGDEGKLLTANEFAILTATSTALAVIEAFSSSNPSLFKACAVNLLGVLARADLSGGAADASTASLIDTLARTADAVVGAAGDPEGETPQVLLANAPRESSFRLSSRLLQSPSMRTS
ncbi:unnamed protein product [Symbiodinium sp. KB8]|nr:unnamed protein product [Symbiodinium sp. KB8]